MRALISFPPYLGKVILFFSFDLKSGYHHVDIHEDSQPYLGFSWGEGVRKKFYLFCVLPLLAYLLLAMCLPNSLGL